MAAGARQGVSGLVLGSFVGHLRVRGVLLCDRAIGRAPLATSIVAFLGSLFIPQRELLDGFDLIAVRAPFRRHGG